MDSERINWHQAFYGALHLEPDEYRSCLEFETEHQLTAEPLRIGLLIIKKKPETVIKKNIGAIFRQVNVIEFKSPDGYISVDDFSKAELCNDGLLLSVYGVSPGSGNGPLIDPGVKRLSPRGCGTHPGGVRLGSPGAGARDT